jgi:hypothetical protein
MAAGPPISFETWVDIIGFLDIEICEKRRRKLHPISTTCQQVTLAAVYVALDRCALQRVGFPRPLKIRVRWLIFSWKF